ncbi:hypothetical protein FQZ97_642330 [compost metagenome]
MLCTMSTTSTRTWVRLQSRNSMSMRSPTRALSSRASNAESTTPCAGIATAPRRSSTTRISRASLR